LSERYQKTFISARHFLESWDKEIYEVTHLDYFIFLLVNHIGNQLEKRFFIRDRKHSPLYLSFESLGSLCFHIGDSFEFFLEDDDDFFQRADVAPNQQIHRQENEEELMRRRVNRLRVLLQRENLIDQRMRYSLSQNVVLDTIIQFYYEEIGIEFDENDMEILELTEFVVEDILGFIHSEGQSLLQHPEESAIDYFEQLLKSDDDYEEQADWNLPDAEFFGHEVDWTPFNPYFEDISQITQKFVEDRSCNPAESAGCIACDIELFEKYLTEYVGISNIYDISKEHLLEFLSVWLVQAFAQEKEPHYSSIYQSMARFVTWLANNYQIDHKRSFLRYYDNVKTEIPRVLRSLNRYLDEYDLFQVLLLREDCDSNQVSGFFEIDKLHSRFSKRLDLINLQLFGKVDNVILNSSIFPQLKKGDILQATLIERNDIWEILEIHYIYPKAAKPFVH